MSTQPVLNFNNFLDEINKLEDEYVQAISVKASEACEEIAKKLCGEIPSEKVFNDGNSRKHLRTSFVVTPERKSATTGFVVHAEKPKYRLVHLIENGHRHFSNALGWHQIPARHFLLPLVEKYKPRLEDEIRRIIEETQSK